MPSLRQLRHVFPALLLLACSAFAQQDLRIAPPIAPRLVVTGAADQAVVLQSVTIGVDIAGGLLKELGYPALQIVNADTETNVDVARSRAEKLEQEVAEMKMKASMLQTKMSGDPDEISPVVPVDERDRI